MAVFCESSIELTLITNFPYSKTRIRLTVTRNQALAIPAFAINQFCVFVCVSLSHARIKRKKLSEHNHQNRFQPFPQININGRKAYRNFQFTETKTAKTISFKKIIEWYRVSYIFFRISTWRSLRSYSCLIFFFSASTNCCFSILNSCMNMNTMTIHKDDRWEKR